ncbi:MAG TPA: tetratricopeptide repeat protein [Acetobacteraceae bacterium]
MGLCSSELAPENVRFLYTYAIALNSTGTPADALAVLQHAHATFPANVEVLSALLSISREQGDMASAITYARELLRLHPNDIRLQMLICDLEQRPQP